MSISCVLPSYSPTFQKLSETHSFVCACVFQRQQVVMTEQLAKTHTNIHFSVMHPGWVDTPGALRQHTCTMLRINSYQRFGQI